MNGLVAVSLAIIMLAGNVSAGVVPADDGSRPSVEDFLRLKSFPLLSPISLSPDGKEVAYTVQDGARIGESTDPESIDERPESGRFTRGCEVRVAEIATGHEMTVSVAGGSSWAPSWSPDGRMIAFFSDVGGKARLWVWNFSSGKAKPIGNTRPQVVDESDVPRWTADSKHVLFRIPSAQSAAIAGNSKTEASSKQSSVFLLDSPQDPSQLISSPESRSTSGLGVANTFAGDLAEMNIDTGELTTLTHGRLIYSYFPSPVRERVAFTVVVGYEAGDTDWTLFDIVVRDLDSGHEVTTHRVMLDNSGSAISWSPDGSELAYGTQVHDNGTRYWLWRADERPAESIGDATTVTYPHYPLWNRKGDRLYVASSDTVYVFGLHGESPRVIHAAKDSAVSILFGSQRDRTLWTDTQEGDSIYLAERRIDSLQTEIHRVLVANGSDERIMSLNAAMALLPMLVTETSRDGGALVFPMESPNAPQDLWVANSGFRALKQLTHINPQLERYRFPERRPIVWTDFDGHELRGTLLFPWGYQEGRRYPLIVDLYGGEKQSRWANQFSATFSGSVENMQIFTAHGYAAFVPDTRMGTETPVFDLFKSLTPGIEKIVSMGIVDGNAIGIIGHSYGGYNVYSLLSQTTRFRAGVALSGSGNLLSHYGEMDPSGFPTGIAWAEKSQGRMLDTPWKARDKYIENSPFFFLDRISTPVLIAHGASDWHPAYEDREMFVGLRRLGKVAEYAEYPGGHRIDGWRYADQLDLVNRVLGWFDKYLPSSPPATSNEESARRSKSGR
ncbi:MAG TPA: prolyl oligopeptidase family serine peptidase [Candidatus Acidoferrum sp.]|nr:prolyl oligopeptidase family serine peptidase [Candidatus Acidoferrum sp.]